MVIEFMFEKFMDSAKNGKKTNLETRYKMHNKNFGKKVVQSQAMHEYLEKQHPLVTMNKSSNVLQNQRSEG